MGNSPRYYEPAPKFDGPEPATVDLCIYGANAAGVIAAVEARRLGLTVALVNPGRRVGGMTTGGLGYTDFGNKRAVGGLAREFYRRVGAGYGQEEVWSFEPHVAEAVLERWLGEIGVEPWRGHYLARADRRGGRISAIGSTSGLSLRAAYYLDCSYEGDLMAAAGVSYAVGRESIEAYGEAYNGQQVHATHQFHQAVDPYVRPGDPASGLLPGIDPDPAFIPGAGDHRIQAYNFRVCMTQRPDLRVPFAKPEHYERSRYELLARSFAAGAPEKFAKFDRIQNGKTDTNNHGAFSTDFIGENWAWPEADYAQRERLFQAHVAYQQGYHWFMAHDPSVPDGIRLSYAQWGLAADEFQDSGHWPPQLYIREARRLRGAAVMTEKNCLGGADASDPVALAAYTMDSHNCRRFVHHGTVLNEGNVEIKLPRPYGISYRSLLPQREQCENLLVPVCLSASHIAYGSIRMEPVFMALAQSAAIAVALAVKAGRCALGDVPYAELKAQAAGRGQVLVWSPSESHAPGAVNEIEMAADPTLTVPPPHLHD